MQFAIDLSGVDRQFTADFDLALATHHAFEHDVVAVGVDVQVIANTHRLHQKAQLCRQFFAHPFDTAHQFTAGFRVDQGNQTIANFQADQIDLVDIVPVQIFGSFGRSGGLRHGFLRGFFFHLALDHQQAQPRGGSSQADEHQMRHAGHQSQYDQNNGRYKQRRRIGQLRTGLLGN